jgi:hypothetical protein
MEEEQDVSESCDQPMTNNDTNLQQIKLEPQFCITYEDEIVEDTNKPPGSDINIKTEPEDTAADFSESFGFN